MGVPLPLQLKRMELHITAPTAFTPRGRYVVGHTARSAETTRMFGRVIRVPAELWCELASVLDLDDLIAAGDRLLSEKSILLTTPGDLVYPAFKIVIEYEGERWHSDPWSVIDIDRYNALNLLGWVVVRVRKNHTAADVERLTRDALVSRGWRG